MDDVDYDRVHMYYLTGVRLEKLKFMIFLGEKS